MNATDQFPGCPEFLARYLLYLATFENRQPSTVADNRINLMEYCRYIHFLNKEGRIPPTKDAHRDIDIRQMDIREVCSFTSDHLREYLCYADSVQKIASTTLCKRITLLNGFYRYLDRNAAELGITLPYGNIVNYVETPKYDTRHSRVLSQAQITKLLDSCCGATQLRDRALILVLATTALTISEIAELKRGDIREDALVVAGTRNNSRVLYLTPACKKALDAYLTETQDQERSIGLFPNEHSPLFTPIGSLRKMSLRAIHKRLETAAARAGLKDIEISARCLRETAARSLLESAEPEQANAVAGYLGLTNPRSVRRYQDDSLLDIINHSRLAQLGDAERS